MHTVVLSEPPERTKAFGIYGTIAETPSVIGQFLGGLLPEVHLLVDGWRLIFLINLPVGNVAVFLAIKYLEKPTRSKLQISISHV